MMHGHDLASQMAAMLASVMIELLMHVRCSVFFLRAFSRSHISLSDLRSSQNPCFYVDFVNISDPGVLAVIGTYQSGYRCFQMFPYTITSCWTDIMIQ